MATRLLDWDRDHDHWRGDDCQANIAGVEFTAAPGLVNVPAGWYMNCLG